jgi:hypothetical protein
MAAETGERVERAAEVTEELVLDQDSVLVPPVCLQATRWYPIYLCEEPSCWEDGADGCSTGCGWCAFSGGRVGAFPRPATIPFLRTPSSATLVPRIFAIGRLQDAHPAYLGYVWNEQPSGARELAVDVSFRIELPLAFQEEAVRLR